MHTLYSDIADSCLQSVHVCIPKTGHNKHNNIPSHNIPGWSEHVKHLSQESLLVTSPLEGLWSTP